MMMGSIELARTICEELKGELPDGEQYGSVDIAEILSAHVRNLEDHIVALKAQRAEGDALKEALTLLRDLRGWHWEYENTLDGERDAMEATDRFLKRHDMNSHQGEK